MSQFSTSGTVVRISDQETINSKDGSKSWEKMTFVIDNKEKYNNYQLIEVFGTDKVSNFIETVSLGDFVNCQVLSSAKASVKDGEEKFWPKIDLINCTVSVTTPAPTPEPQQLDPQQTESELDDLPF